MARREGAALTLQLRAISSGLKLSASFAGVTVLLAGCAPGPATVVENGSGSPFVVHAMDEGSSFHASRYYAVPSGASVLIDTVGHVNPAVETVTLMSQECQVIEVVEGNYLEGATVAIHEDESVEFEYGRTVSLDLLTLRGPDEVGHSYETCEDAAASL
jgi:hypothetical protein